MYKKREAKTPPIKWTNSEVEYIKDYIEGKLDYKRVQSELSTRTNSSIKNKIRKMRIKLDVFGEEYRDKKIEFTNKIANQVHPSRVFDAYAGSGHQTFEWIKIADVVYASERDTKKYNMLINKLIEFGWILDPSDLNGWDKYVQDGKRIYTIRDDAVRASTFFYPNNIKIDLIDLDTCGSTVLTIPTYLNNIRPKHMVITFGEYHSFRMNRIDVLHRIFPHIDIKEDIDFTYNEFREQLNKALLSVTFRTHNEIEKSFYPREIMSIDLDQSSNKLIRTLYKLEKPESNADILNELISS